MSVSTLPETTSAPLVDNEAILHSDAALLNGDHATIAAARGIAA